MARFIKWREKVLAAREPRELTQLLGSALQEVSPDEIGGLPHDCQLAVARAPQDVHGAAVTLLHADLVRNADGELLRQLAQLFASASVRLSLIEHRRV